MVAAVVRRQGKEPTATLTASLFDLDQFGAIAGRIVSECGRNANPNFLARSSKFWHAFTGDRGRGGCVSSHG